MTTPSDPADPTSGRDVMHGCDFVESVAAEFALGSLTGADRSIAIAHLDACDRCRALVKHLSSAADSLLLMAPEMEPPAGFEVRLLARRERAMSGAASPVGVSVAAPAANEISASITPLRPRARLAVGAVAAAAVAVAGVGIGFAVAPRPASRPAALVSLRSAPLTDRGATLGEVVISEGSPSWVLMTLDKPGWSGWVECQVTSGGHARNIGSFFVRNSGSWGVQMSSSGRAVTSARIIGPTGAVLATARFG